MAGHASFAETKAAYWKVFAALMVLLILTVGVAFIDLGPANIFVAMAVAVVKATLVVRVFMHVGEATRLTKLWAVLGFVWLIILFGLIYVDYAARGVVGPVNGWEAPY